MKVREEFVDGMSYEGREQVKSYEIKIDELEDLICCGTIMKTMINNHILGEHLYGEREDDGGVLLT